MTMRKKVFVSIVLTVPALVLSYLGSIVFSAINRHTFFWTQYTFIHLIGMLISTLILEVILTNFQVMQKLIKAEKIQTVSHLAASISHEVRNPLTASRGFIQMLVG